MTRPIALTLGDPSGIGPELAAKAWAALGGDIPLVAIGDAEVLRQQNLPVAPVTEPVASQTALSVLHIPTAAPVTPGVPQPENAAAIIRSIETGVEAVTSGDAAALVTNPINKKVLKDGAGFVHPGHTEFLAALDGKAQSVMMLACPDLKVVPVTIHIALSEVKAALTPALLEETIRITHAAMIRDFGIKIPRLAIAGLNPHAGEGGIMGREEIEVIAPVIERLSGEGLSLSGPHSADTMFHKAARERYDVAIAMYHDQALIPVKTLGFEVGVNATLGLSFIRTSPDHGTAFDIAGKGIADATSLIEAIRLAAEMGARRG